MTQISRFVRLLVSAALIGVSLGFPLRPSTLHAQDSGMYQEDFGPSALFDLNAYHGPPANHDGFYTPTTCSDGLPGLKDGLCGDPSLPFGSIRNSLGLCTNDRSVSCIESLEISAGGEWLPAIAESDIPFCSSCGQTATWSSIPKFDISASNGGSLFRLDGVVGVPSLWYVFAFYKFELYHLSSPHRRPDGYIVEVAPVELIPTSQEIWNSERRVRFGEFTWLRMLPDKSFQARLTLNLKFEPSTWLRTYLTESSTEVARSPRQSGRFLLRVAGKSSRLPSASMNVTHSDIARRKKLCSSVTTTNHIKTTGFCGPDHDGSSFYVIRSSLNEASIRSGGHAKELFDAYAEKLNLFPELDRATKEQDYWAFSFLMRDPRQLEECPLASGIYGLVGGNSMLISDEAPLWNQRTQSLEFTVASPHYRPNGETAVGFYEMQLNEKVAQCLWGTSITPQNVSLSVLDDNGETKNAVATVAVQNGMVIFRASGFTYSISTLRASLKKPEPATVTSTVKPARRISCTKNGVAKLQPKGVTTCPKGWRKK